MKLDNRTALQAHLFWGTSGERSLGCSVVLKATYDLTDDGPRLTEENPWPVHLEPLKTPYGTFPAEGPQRKPRLDLIVLGQAHAPDEGGVRRMTVSAALDDFCHSVEVFGDRVWTRRKEQWVPGEPEPFRVMPLVYERAFGGEVANEWGELAEPNNPAGVGFCIDREQAGGRPLPNIEDPDQLVRTPLDRPGPAGLAPYPLEGGLRLSRYGEIDMERPAIPPYHDFEHLLANWAHPDLMLERGVDHKLARISGISPDGPLEAAIQPLDVQITLCHGQQRRPLQAVLDTIIIEGEARRLVQRWRAAATFPMKPREIRRVVVTAGDEETA